MILTDEMIGKAAKAIHPLTSGGFDTYQQMARACIEAVLSDLIKAAPAEQNFSHRE